MATVIHHHHVASADVPTGVYWTVGIVLAMLAGVLFYFSAAPSTTELAMPLMLPPVTPFIPLM